MPKNLLKLQRPYTDAEARDNLLLYTEEGDRNPPPIFVGREEIIGELAEDISFCRSNTDRIACFTSVIAGVPSAGKTSLLSEITERFKRDMHGSRNEVAVVRMSWNDLSHEVRVASKFISSCLGVQLTARDEENLAQYIQATGSPWCAIRDNIPVEREPHVWLLLVDESQNIEGVGGGPGHNHIVSDLHTGRGSTNGLKIVTVFAGLLDTPSALYQTGLSRLRDASTIHLGGLTLDETKNLVSRWMTHEGFGLENVFSDPDIDRVSDMLAVACDCWPRHAYDYLCELGHSILDAGVTEDRIIDLDAVFNRGHDLILRYYSQRAHTADLDSYYDVIQDLAKPSIDGVFTQRELFQHAKDHYRMTDSEISKQHEWALHTGILDQADIHDRQRVRFPIPSQFIYMKAGSGKEFTDEMRDRMTSLAHVWSEPKGLEL